MSDLAKVWLIAALWAFAALYDAVADDSSPTIVICSIGFTVCLLNVALTWRDDREQERQQ